MKAYNIKKQMELEGIKRGPVKILKETKSTEEKRKGLPQVEPRRER